MTTGVAVGIVGASGYSGEELVRLLLAHPHARLSVVTSRQLAGQTVAEAFARFAHLPRANELIFSGSDPQQFADLAEVFFLALPHGVAGEIGAQLAECGKRVIDLSADFRLRDAALYRAYYGHDHPAPELLKRSVYGLCEIYGERIREAQIIGNPGCYPTSILLPLIPLLREKLIDPQGLIADCYSGVSGAGRKAELGYLFVECNESARPYGVLNHRHLSEIEQELAIAAGLSIVIQFTPHLMPLNRGILTTLYARPRAGVASDQLQRQITECYRSWYSARPFVRLLAGDALPDTKNVSGTNVLELALRVDPRTNHVVIMSALDNLVKGASGQAVQNFNLAYGFEETAGLL